jgi:hypothetical protein
MADDADAAAADDIGVVYAAFGVPYLVECQVSARSLLRVSPGIPIAVFCDPAHAASPPPELEAWFAPLMRGEERCVVESSSSSSSALRGWQTGTCTKIAASIQSPYAKTLLLDCDTVVLGDVRPIFRLLPRFDVAAAFCTPWVAGQCTAAYLRMSEAPLIFPEYNTGVLLLHTASEAVRQFLQTWDAVTRRLDAAGAHSSDQQGFREAAWLSPAVKLTTLKQNFNSWGGNTDHMPIVIAHKGLNKGGKALSRGSRRLVAALRESEAWGLVARAEAGEREGRDHEALLQAERALLARRGWTNSPLGRAWAVLSFPWVVLRLTLTMVGVAAPPKLSSARDDVNAVAFVLKARQAWKGEGYEEERGLRGLWRLLVESHGDTPVVV